MLSADILLIFKTYIVSVGLQFLIWPLVKKIFGRLPDEGWALGRVIITLISALIIWQLSYFGFAENNPDKLYAILAFVGLISLWLVWKGGLKAFTSPRTTAKVIAIEEYLFLVGFWVDGPNSEHTPRVWIVLEKYMDFGFLNQYLVAPKLPAMDMWQAGMTINYYSFGHFWGQYISKSLGSNPGNWLQLDVGFYFRDIDESRFF